MRVLVVHPAPPTYLLASLVRAGAEVVVAGSPGPLAGARLLAVDVFDAEALASIVAVAHQDAPFSVVLPTWEGTCEQTSRLAAMLGLPGNPVEAVVRSRQKDLAAAVLGAAGVGTPRTRVVGDLDEAVEAVEADGTGLGYPVIVKLPASTNSQSVTLAANRGELERAVAGIAAVYRQGGRLGPLWSVSDPLGPNMLVQEYVDGPELNIDLLYRDEVHVVLGVFEKAPMTGPLFGEIYSVHPASVESEQLRFCVETAARAVRALGATLGAAHVELRCGPRGPSVIDIGLRPGGAYTAQAIEALTGLNVHAELAAMLAGGTLPRVPEPTGACLYGGVLVERAGMVEAVEGIEAFERTPGMLDYRVLIGPGDAVQPLPQSSDYHVAHFVMRGESRDDLLSQAARLRAEVRCRYKDTS